MDTTIVSMGLGIVLGCLVLILRLKAKLYLAGDASLHESILLLQRKSKVADDYAIVVSAWSC